MKEYKTIVHPLEPIWSQSSKILFLGTMPSPKSRDEAFYYAHPRNRFWPVLSILLGHEVNDKEDKTKLLLSNNIAVWDVLKSCEISGAADSSIKNPVPNDIKYLIDNSEIENIFTTGSTAYNLYNKLCADSTGIRAVKLPSTSPANAKMSLDELVKSYSVILNYI